MIRNAYDYDDTNVFYKYNIEEFLDKLNTDNLEYNFEEAGTPPPEALDIESDEDFLANNLPELLNLSSTFTNDLNHEQRVENYKEDRLNDATYCFEENISSRSSNLDLRGEKMTSESFINSQATKGKKRNSRKGKLKYDLSGKRCPNCRLPFYSNETQCNDCGFSVCSKGYRDDRAPHSDVFVNSATIFQPIHLSNDGTNTISSSEGNSLLSPWPYYSGTEHDSPASTSSSSMSSHPSPSTGNASDTIITSGSTIEQKAISKRRLLNSEDKYKKLKDQNNEASRQYRNRKKLLKQTLQSRLGDLQKKNSELSNCSSYLERKFEECLQLKADIEALGISFPGLNLN